MTQIAPAATEPGQLGARRSREVIAARVGQEVTAEEFQDLVNRGHLVAAGQYKGWPTYSVTDLGAMPADVVLAAAAEYQRWVAAAIPVYTVAADLRVPAMRLQQALRAAGVDRLRGDLMSQSDAVDIAAGPCTEPGAAVWAQLALAPVEAAAWLEIRRTDLTYLRTADILQPARYDTMRVGRRGAAEVPLFALDALARLRQDDRLPWKELLAVAPGERSPLIKVCGTSPVGRAHAVRTWAATAAADLGVGVLVDWDPWARRWDVAWDQWHPSAPTRVAVEDHLAAAEGMRRHLDALNLQAPCPSSVWWARAMLRTGAAVVLDTETTGLDEPDVLEVAVIDAATGRTLLNTRVATELPIEPGAAAVHGIDAADLVDAPTWDQVLPRLRRATKGRTILAYSAAFDAAAIAATTARRPRLQAQHLANPRSWACLMDATQDRWRLLRPERLNGGHAALSDCHAARDLLRAIAQHRDVEEL